ncbi:MAG: Ig-like domain-containing protein [Prevotellaceae bacterium]|jgi:uncharacterized protein (TIGR02145 family)|nr:Ig-like domain-containing protein [Prevotellaceae bacterium]
MKTTKATSLIFALALLLPVTAAALGKGGTIINGLEWANANVAQPGIFASQPDMYTEFYQWNRGKAWPAPAGDTISEYWSTTPDQSPTWTVNPCPAGWRIPAMQELQSLHNGGSTWADVGDKGNAVAGQFFGPNHAAATISVPQNGIFLPAGGWRLGSIGNNGKIIYSGKHGVYWSSTQESATSGYRLSFYKELGGGGIANNGKESGHNLRCVRTPITVTGVSLNENAATPTTTHQLTATVAPNDADDPSVSWSSSNENVATVDGTGLVTLKTIGEAIITVTTNEGSFTATCTLTISSIAVTAVSLNQTATTLEVGATAQLTATVAPANATNPNVSWSSDAESVATVVDGLVTAVAPGMANIIVTTADGNFVDTCTVTVFVNSVTGVSLNQTATTLEVDSTAQLTATVAPANATNPNVSWSSDAEGVATVVDGLVTAVAPGTANIIVTTADGSFVDTCTVTVCNLVVDGLCWADANVDDPLVFAAKPDTAGKFYQWNLPEKAWPATGDPDNWTVTSISGDAAWASTPCPPDWRLPTKEEYEALDAEGGELSDNKGGTWANANAGRGNAAAGRFYGKNHATCSLPNSMAGCIFLPAQGHRIPADGTLTNPDSSGDYWSSTQNDNDNAAYQHFASGNSSISNFINKATGLAVRCVR